MYFGIANMIRTLEAMTPESRGFRQATHGLMRCSTTPVCCQQRRSGWPTNRELRRGRLFWSSPPGEASKHSNALPLR